MNDIELFENVYNPGTAADFIEKGSVISTAFETESGTEATFGIIDSGTKAKFPADTRGEFLTLDFSREDIADTFPLTVTNPGNPEQTENVLLSADNPSFQVPGGWEISVDQPDDALPIAYTCEYITK